MILSQMVRDNLLGERGQGCTYQPDVSYPEPPLKVLRMESGVTVNGCKTHRDSVVQWAPCVSSIAAYEQRGDETFQRQAPAERNCLNRCESAGKPVFIMSVRFQLADIISMIARAIKLACQVAQFLCVRSELSGRISDSGLLYW